MLAYIIVPATPPQNTVTPTTGHHPLMSVKCRYILPTPDHPGARKLASPRASDRPAAIALPPPRPGPETRAHHKPKHRSRCRARMQAPVAPRARKYTLVYPTPCLTAISISQLYTPARHLQDHERIERSDLTVSAHIRIRIALTAGCELECDRGVCGGNLPVASEVTRHLYR